MRTKLIAFLKMNPILLQICWKSIGFFLKIMGVFIPINSKTILFSSFGGRKFDDSPKALYDEICSRDEFKDYNLIWAFVDTNNYQLPRGKKVKIDTFTFFKCLLQSKVWISNTGMDRGIALKRKNTIKIETWHGTPLKKIGGDENSNVIGGKKKIRFHKNKDSTTIRCAQSEYDRKIFARIFNATENSILLSDLPRNDKLLQYTNEEINLIKENLHIPKNKKVILYAPTYREYLIDHNSSNYIAPPINLKKWEKTLSSNYVLLIRAHYAVTSSLNISNSEFVKDVSKYLCLNDLYAISDMMISDYSSTFFDFSILNRPMFCFAYDLKEYEEKRGLYLPITVLPCKINKNEDELLYDILNLNIEQRINQSKHFHHKFAPNAGKASKLVVDELLERLNE